MTPKATTTGPGDETLTDRVSVAVAREDKKVFRRAAYLSDQSVSAFMRAAAFKAAERVERVAAKKAA